MKVFIFLQKLSDMNSLHMLHHQHFWVEFGAHFEIKHERHLYTVQHHANSAHMSASTLKNLVNTFIQNQLVINS